VRLLCVATLLCLLITIGCSGDGPTSPSTGTLAVRLTDAPTDLLAQINVYIVGLTVKRSDAPNEQIASDIGLVDLLSLRDTSQLLATVGVEPGFYNHIFVDLDQDQSNVVELASGLEQPLQIASEQIKVLGGFEVRERGTTTVLLDFDAEASIRQQGNGGWLLVPVIVQANVQID
jgi:hypothetical protein